MNQMASLPGMVPLHSDITFTKHLWSSCGPSPDPPDWHNSLLKEKKERKILCSPVLKNPSPARNGVVWSRHLLFIFIFKIGKIKWWLHTTPFLTGGGFFKTGKHNFFFLSFLLKASRAGPVDRVRVHTYRPETSGIKPPQISCMLRIVFLFPYYM